MPRKYSLKVNEKDSRLRETADIPFLYEKTFEDIRADSYESFIEDNSSILAIIENLPNGISIIAPGYKIVYLNRKMREWYASGGRMTNVKCYRLFHKGQKGPCRECPAKTCKETKKAASVIQYCDAARKTAGAAYLHIHVFPILNVRDEVVAYVEYVFNLTEQLDTSEEISAIRSQLVLLNHENAILKKELESYRQRMEELEKNVSDNLKNYVKPALDYLGTRVSAEEQKIFASLIEEAVFPITGKRIAKGLNLSARELEIAMMIKEGKSSKEIADALYITKKAVDYHRANIRKKLALDSKTNLQVYLEAYL